MKRQAKKQDDMSCQTCGKPNVDMSCVIYGPPVADCPFSMNGGKGMICLDCYTKQEAA